MDKFIYRSFIYLFIKPHFRFQLSPKFIKTFIYPFINLSKFEFQFFRIYLTFYQSIQKTLDKSEWDFCRHRLSKPTFGLFKNIPTPFLYNLDAQNPNFNSIFRFNWCFIEKNRFEKSGENRVRHIRKNRVLAQNRILFGGKLVVKLVNV